jgi:hypothetical protein
MTQDVYGDLAIVCVRQVARLCDFGIGRRRRAAGEQIRLQVRSLPYDPRLAGVTDPMEHR